MRSATAATASADDSRARRAAAKAGAVPSAPAIPGASATERPSATTSRGVARPRAMRPAMRATSCTPSQASRSASSVPSSATSAATASWRARIDARSPSGAHVHSRSSRRPMGVRARWMTESRVPSVPPVRRVRSTSRLRSVVASRTRCAAVPPRRGGRRWASGLPGGAGAPGSVPRPRCASSRWRSSAPAAAVDGSSSRRSNASSVRTPKCSFTSAAASCARNIQDGPCTVAHAGIPAMDAPGPGSDPAARSGSSSSLGARRTSASGREAASQSSTVNSPVESSMAATPTRSPASHAHAMRLGRASSRRVSSTSVPGEMTRVTPRSTTPLASAGSCSCSHTATRWPCSTRRRR